jgi:hypothetical protein
MEKAEVFWKWFEDHNEQLVAMGDLEEKERTELENALQYQLTKYCNGLTYEIGDATANGRTLTFTAEGDTDLFRYVVELVDAAPDLDWWEFVAFKQPMGTELKVRFGLEGTAKDSVTWQSRHTNANSRLRTRADF